MSKKISKEMDEFIKKLQETHAKEEQFWKEIEQREKELIQNKPNDEHIKQANKKEEGSLVKLELSLQQKEQIFKKIAASLQANKKEEDPLAKLAQSLQQYVGKKIGEIFEGALFLEPPGGSSVFWDIKLAAQVYMVKVGIFRYYKFYKPGPESELLVWVNEEGIIDKISINSVSPKYIANPAAYGNGSKAVGPSIGTRGSFRNNGFIKYGTTTGSR